MTLSVSNFGIYVHVPFCSVRCGYCDFNTYTPDELQRADASDSWAESLVKEITYSLEQFQTPQILKSIFFGGGTPSLLAPEILKKIFLKINSEFKYAEDVEITLEANPDTITKEIVKTWIDLGINRISIGMQSSDPAVLKTLDRTHNPENVKRAVDILQAAGLFNFSLDLIYGTPGESLTSWERTVNAAIELDPPHISAYALTIEPGTALYRKAKSQQVAPVSSDDQADKYLLVDRILSERNLLWYEISNWSKPGFECRHNLNYWNNQNWWGYGPGAHSHLNGVRWWNVKHPFVYSKKLIEEKSAIEEKEILSVEQKYLERVMLKLRLKSSDLKKIVPKTTRVHWMQEGLLKEELDNFELTPKGRLLLDTLVNQLT
jgi:putative oxygen-independent coproporphyrinogen III oxidase